MNNGRNEAPARGRPVGAERGELEARLLETAERRFGEDGYAATPIRAIAEEAGANPALVHYYFGSKQDLLVAVLDRALEPMADAMRSLRRDGSAGPAEVTALLQRLLMEHPALPRLVVREVLLAGGEFRKLFMERYAPRLGGALPPMLRHMQDEGRLRNDLDPRILALLLLGLCLFPAIARPLAEPVLGIDHSPEGLGVIQRHIDALLEGGLAP